MAGGQIIYGGTGTGQSLAILPNTVNSPMDGCLVLYGAIAWGNVITSALLTADQNDYTQSGINGCSVLRLRMDAARTITGIDSKSSNPSYRNMIVMNVGTFDITLANNSASSTVNNRFKFSNSYSKVLKPGGSIWLMQDNNDMGWHEIGLPAQFVYAEGMAGGQLVSGGTAASENLTLQSTSHSTKGEVRITDKLVASNQVAHSGHISATGLLGALNDWAPTGIATASYIYLTTNGSTTLTGIAGGTAGRILTLYHGGSTPLYLAGNDAGSIAANRLSLTSQSLHTGDSITFEYEAINSRWRILSTGNKSVLTQGAQGGQTIYGGINAGENLTLRGSTTTPGGVGIANGMALITGTATGTLSGPLHDFNPTNVPWGILTLNPSGSDLVITGLVKPSGMNLNNYVMILVNGSDFNITLPCESGFSAAANRWYTPGIVDYIIPARGAVQVLYDNTVSRWRILSSQSAPAVSETPWPPLYRTGIRWYRDGTDFVNDVVIQPGKARDDADTVNMELTTQVTKRLDAAWAFGDMQGGLDTGARAANTWYYMWLIKRVDTGVTDILFSTSNSAPTMPANYTKKRLIGEFKTNATNIQPTYVGEIGGGAFYIQMLDLPSQGLDVNVTNCTTSQTTRALPSLPQLGTPIQVDLNVFIQHASIITIVFIGNTALYSGIPSVTVSPLGSIRTTTATVGNNANVRTSTDINSQISDYSLNSATTLRIQVLGYVRPNVM